MLRSTALYLFGRHAHLRALRCQAPRMYFNTMLQAEDRNTVISSSIGKEGRTEHNSHQTKGPMSLAPGHNLSRREKISFLIKAVTSRVGQSEDTKDAVYGTLDSWVAWEQNFPIAPLKNVLLALEKEQQWHRIVQVLQAGTTYSHTLIACSFKEHDKVIKWMLSKGQGNTNGTYQQLIHALDKDHRAEEAHNIWMKIGNDLHSVPWQTCHVIISVYYRNNMLDRLVKLFKGLEAFGHKPTEKKIVQKVADAYELLGLVDEKERILTKYADIFNQSNRIRLEIQVQEEEGYLIRLNP